jgi:hypothetical protein
VVAVAVGAVVAVAVGIAVGVGVGVLVAVAVGVIVGTVVAVTPMVGEIATVTTRFVGDAARETLTRARAL